MSPDRSSDDRSNGGIAGAVGRLGPGPLTEAGLVEHVWPLFSRVLAAGSGGPIYLANHSLGRPLDRTAEDVAAALDHWYTALDGAWGPWSEAMTRFRTLVARLVGCPRPDAVVHKTSAGQGLRAVLNAIEPKAARPRVLATRGEFDACDFILKAYAGKGRIDLDWIEPDSNARFHAQTISARLTPAHDLLLVSHAIFSTGQILEGIEPLASRARSLGCLTLLDVYHTAGVIPLDLHTLGVDAAIGGSYKYTRGGPGACWLALRAEHLDNTRLRPIDTGWFAKADHFGYERSDEAVYARGGDGWQEGTPAVLCMVQALAGLELTLALGVQRLREYNLRQRSFLAERLRERGVTVIDEEPRGAFVLLPADDPGAMTETLRGRGLIVDGRRDPLGRGSVRLCPDLLNTQQELSRAADLIGTLGPIR
jgi:kynureninase